MNSAWARFGDRNSALRASDVPAEHANLLGMKSYDQSADLPPLRMLQDELRKVQSRIPLTSEGRRVLSGVFDAYRSNFIAPDHLLTGLTKTVIELGLKVSQTMGLDQDFVDVYLCHALKNNGLLSQETSLNSKSELN